MSGRRFVAWTCPECGAVCGCKHLLPNRLADPTHVVVTDGSSEAERDVYAAQMRAAAEVWNA